MNKEKKVVIFDKRKIELMKEIRKQIESIRKNLVMLQSGNGGELTETMDDIVFEVRRANSQLDGMLERTIDFQKNTYKSRAKRPVLFLPKISPVTAFLFQNE